MPPPAYTRLPVDERRRQVLEAGARLFEAHAYEDISMRQIAQAAGISKPLLYHYFPGKLELFRAALAESAAELQSVIEPAGDGPPLEQLTESLDGYLAWIEGNSRIWTRLMASAATLPEAGDLVEGFRATVRDRVLERLAPGGPRPALRSALTGWLGYVDAAILDWIESADLSREQLRNMILAAFGAALFAAQQADPEITLELG
jgi:AcrR family transcriptional regulator